MTPERAEALGDYIRYLLAELDLRDWTITLKTDEHPEQGNADAEIHPVYGRRVASLYVPLDFFSYDSERQRHILVHELLHCHMAGIQHHATHGKLIQVLGVPAHDAWFAGYEQMVENAVDAIADAFARRLEPPRLPADAPCPYDAAEKTVSLGGA